MAVFAIAANAFDPALGPLDARMFGDLAQIGGIEDGVEMKGMGDAVEARVRDLRQPREAVRARRRFVQRIVAEPPPQRLRSGPAANIAETGAYRGCARSARRRAYRRRRSGPSRGTRYRA